ncbi:hypothetical protein LCGC14_0515860 [marine sediment metagenome]|uniref:Uncharacterized protein n=1 Tax=marine sediment metagenome TaxID=412755 RepID=A0A0F9S4N5_9ZZZZ
MIGYYIESYILVVLWMFGLYYVVGFVGILFLCTYSSVGV